MTSSRLEIHDSDDYRLIVMKYYPWNLEDLTRRFFQGSKRYTPSHLRFIGFAFRGMLRAVGELHKTGFVHRDLKLDNFMVDEQCKFRSMQLISILTTSNWSPGKEVSITRSREPLTTCPPKDSTRRREPVCPSEERSTCGLWA